MVVVDTPVATRSPGAKPADHPAVSGSSVIDGDTVSLTPAASNDRSGRVDELRRQYQDGAYQVDEAEVSTRIVERHIEP